MLSSINIFLIPPLIIRGDKCVKDYIMQTAWVLERMARECNVDAVCICPFCQSLDIFFFFFGPLCANPQRFCVKIPADQQNCRLAPTPMPGSKSLKSSHFPTDAQFELQQLVFTVSTWLSSYLYGECVPYALTADIIIVVVGCFCFFLNLISPSSLDTLFLYTVSAVNWNSIYFVSAKFYLDRTNPGDAALLWFVKVWKPNKVIIVSLKVHRKYCIFFVLFIF